MPRLTKPLYQINDGPDEDRWRLAFDTDTRRLFVEHEKTRGDTRGSGYSTETDEMAIADYLGESGQGQQQLLALLGALFEEGKGVSGFNDDGRRDNLMLESTITCPSCGHTAVETMPTDACQFFYDCKGCGTRLKPRPGDCCVYCSYGSVPCPPIQQDGKCC